MPQWIAAQDLPLLRQIVRPGILLVLLLHMGELPSATKLAALLDMNRRTIARYLKDLVRLGLIQPHPYKWGYLLAETLSEEQQRLLEIFNPSHPSGA